MNILFVAPEATPFIKTGGLGEVVGSLPKALGTLNVDARIILPKYGKIDEAFKKEMKRLYEGTIRLGWRQQYLGLYELQMNGGTYYFIDNEFYFKRDTIYGSGGVTDEAERFAFFSKAVLEAIPHMNWRPEILHLHDWQTALIPLFYHATYRNLPSYVGLRSILTIHNLKYQGIFPANVLPDILDVGWEYFTPDKLEFFGNVNFLKGGIAFADAITTVSPTYAEEIQNPYYGEGLDGLLRFRRNDLYGILNGIDVEAYNPKTDPHLLFPYEENREEKIKNKEAIQAFYHLPVGDEKMLIVMIVRLVEQKGIDLIMRILPDMMREDVQLVILGDGEWRYEAFFRHAEHLYPDKLRLHTKYKEDIAHRLYAAGDLLLMPSRFEPCGISQMIAMRYLTVPLVRLTGGLKDTVRPYDPSTHEGDGFTFYDYNAHEMLYAFQRAVSLYQDKEEWRRILQNLTKKDFRWTSSAQKYLEVYHKVLERSETGVQE